MLAAWLLHEVQTRLRALLSDSLPPSFGCCRSASACGARMPDVLSSLSTGATDHSSLRRSAWTARARRVHYAISHLGQPERLCDHDGRKGL